MRLLDWLLGRDVQAAIEGGGGGRAGRGGRAGAEGLGQE